MTLTFTIYSFLFLFLFILFPLFTFTETHTRYQNNASGLMCSRHLGASSFFYTFDCSSHSKNTILGIFCGTIQASRDTETYDFSCVSWINNTIIPEPCCGVIRTSFSLICLHNLCLESFLFFLVPLHHIMHCKRKDK